MKAVKRQLLSSSKGCSVPKEPFRDTVLPSGRCQRAYPLSHLRERPYSVSSKGQPLSPTPPSSKGAKGWSESEAVHGTRSGAGELCSPTALRCPWGRVGALWRSVANKGAVCVSITNTLSVGERSSFGELCEAVVVLEPKNQRICRDRGSNP